MKKTIKKKGTGGRVLKGVMVGAALGVAAGLLLSPKSGKKLRSDISKKYAELSASMAPKLKNLKNMGEKEYVALAKKAVEAFVKGKKISEKEVPKLVKLAKANYKNIKKSLSK